MNHPDLVIADEPTANLDSATGNEVLQVIKGLNERDGVTFIFSTHNPAILSFATRLIRLKDGELGDCRRGGGVLMFFVRLAILSILSHRRRSTVIAVSVAVSVVVMIFVEGMLGGLRSSFFENLLQGTGHVQIHASGMAESA